MSAWDIAGAVVWTPLAIVGWGSVIMPNRHGTEKACLVGAIIFSLSAAFCISRLLGAHA